MLRASQRVGFVDFGPLDFIEPLELMLHDLIHEAHLTRLGHLVAPYYIKQILSMRLRVQKAAHERQAGEISAPIFILGLPRTGSSLLHELLALHPDLRAPTFWASHHWPGGQVRNAFTQTLTRLQVGVVDVLAPDFRRVHALAAMAPHECVSIQGYSLRSMQFHVAFRLPSYNRWMVSACDWAPAYAWHRKYLSLLPDTGQRWVLKAPGHMLGLSALLAQYPDARFIQTHRHPVEVIPSMASLTQSLRGLASDFDQPHEIGQDVNALWRQGIENVMLARAREPSLDARFIDIKYDELVADPDRTMQKITEFTDVRADEIFSQAQARHLAENPKHQHGRHTYTPQQFGLSPDQLELDYADYIHHYL